MSKSKVFITRHLPKIDLEPLHQIAEIEIWTARQPPPYSLLLDKVKEIDGLLCLLTDSIDRELIETGKSLKVISQMAVGYDNIDVAAATAKHIPVGNTPGVLTNATADLTWALLMAIARRIVEAERFVQAGEWKTWEPTLLLGADLQGATLGIIGLGRIGQAVARRARGFDMKVLYYSRRRKNKELEESIGVEYAELDTLLSQADIISLHTSLSPETEHLISDRELQLMKSSAILINTARGAIINQQALYQALINNQIAGAALDVTDPEPIPMDSPLLKLNNIIITPHIGSASYQTRAKMAQMAVDNLIAGLQGTRLPHCVNKEVYQK
ncbi:Glyoxylate reductase [Stanieria cyanosphaera PCC 7437]|uniref:Glyoxylate reductase n=1 Tax=Stanieria cyanosphaera (strain ATCC 29371 / PCC 7437) TaxID=111780 RepID=K9XUQ2_STAC7|nr:D-glycerate dehydrogenase [Stanieria cyanosphaera]AFZ35789.1 Glyoxylate reductase [Stanieria cyanosphaera PCC 7437]